MELYQDIFRVISLVVVWAIPTILVVAVIVFAILAPVMTLSGVFLRLYQAIHNVLDKLPRGGRAKTKPSLDVGTVPERPVARDERTIELVGTKTQPSLDIGAVPRRPAARDERTIESVRRT